MKRLLCLAIACVMAAPTSAQIIDGTLDGVYGPALALQTVETQFGDNFSELNAGYGTISGGLLNLMLTGNIEGNFNKLEIFIDSKAGGQGVFDSSGNDGANAMDGLVFDAGFTADYHIIVRRGNDGGDKFDIDFANLGTQSASGYLNIFGGSQTGSGSTGTGVNASPILVAYDNSNTAGVLGGTAAANQAAAAAVTTGLELGIALSDLGYTGGPINIMAGVNNQNHNYWSNQFLGGLTAPQGNLGGDGAGGFTGSGAVNLASGLTPAGQPYATGDQFFTVVPEPASLALLGLSMLGLACGRGRRS